VQKFYKDIEEQYDDKLGFESQLNKLRSEIATVNTNLRLMLASPIFKSPAIIRQIFDIKVYLILWYRS
jgi:hypothetical protein